MVSSSTDVDCGPIILEFFNDDDTKTSLDSSLFIDDSNSFITMKQADENELKVRVYPILYRMYYEEYPTIVVEQTVPFTVTVEDACGMDVNNSLHASELTDQEYTISDSLVTY